MINMYGIYIRYMRKSRGYTQLELAKKLFIAPCTLSHYESGLRMVPFTIFELVMDLCGYSIKILDCETGVDITKLEISKLTDK